VLAIGTKKSQLHRVSTGKNKILPEFQKYGLKTDPCDFNILLSFCLRLRIESRHDQVMIM